MRSLAIVFVALSVIATAWATSGGAPIAACATMTPMHGVTGQDLPMPYTVTVDNEVISPGDSVQITITADPDVTFRGFLIQVRQGTLPVGIFEIDSADAHTLDCSMPGNSATHANPSDKSEITVTWVAPDTLTEDLIVMVSVVQVRLTFWAAVPTVTLTVAN